MPVHQRRPQVRWVALPPPGATPPRPPLRRPYTGPPSYPAPPRWGFPQLAWRWPVTVAGTGQRHPSPADDVAVRRAGRVAATMAAVTAVTAVIATVAELLRYGLLVASLSGPVASGLVLFSDTLVIAAGLVTVVFAVAALLLVLRWLVAARELATARDGHPPARSDLWMVASLVIPVWNLVGPLSVVAELEHRANSGDPSAMPRPSRAVWTWWGCWLFGAAMFTLTFVWGFLDSIQAIADGVLLHAATDGVGAVVALLSARLVAQLTGTLTPATSAAEPLRYRRVLAVGDLAPSTERAPRPAGAPR